MYVIAALHNTQPEVAARAFELVNTGADVQGAVLPTLLNDLDMFDGEITLILDDYHLVTSGAVHEQLTFVLDRMPATLRLVIATRADPSLPLARLRARGDLLELRADDLRFAEIEACRLLNDVGELGLADEDITLLCRRTEGWAAGLYLVALSLAGRDDAREFIRAFAGDNRHIVDYLSAEVLDGLDAQLRGFLVRTSVLDRLTGALCDVVLDIAGSASILQRIERENLFVIPLDSSRGWYRYHHLFGELLRGELHRSEPDLVPVLHQRAGTWFRDAGDIDAAVRHLIAGGENTDAAELIAANWATYFNLGRVSTVSGWLDLLPHRTVSSDPRLSVARAWTALYTQHDGDADTWIDAAEAALAAGRVEAGAIPAELVVQRAASRFRTGALAESLDLAGRAIRLDLGYSPHAPSAAYCIYGSALYFSDRVEEARAAFCQAVPLAERVANHVCRVYALGYLATIAVDQDRVSSSAT
jgi:LuxR family maltose regulon positive regulatory protein